MLLIIAVLYFLGIQSVAPNNCPRLRCTSRRTVDPQDIRFKCSLSSSVTRSSRLPQQRRRHAVVYSNASTSSDVKGLCVTDLHLDNLRLNVSARHVPSSSYPPSTLQLLLKQLTGLGLKTGKARMVCNTEPLSDRVSVWQRCRRLVPRLEVVENLPLDNKVVCVVCGIGVGDSELVYHSISETVLLRFVFRNPSSISSSTLSSLSSNNVVINTPSVILDLRLFSANVQSADGGNQDNGLTESPKSCRWKCGSLPTCLLSESLLCDGVRHCPSGQDEIWCKRPVAERDSGRASWKPVLGLPLVYALITLGCVLGFIFLLLCFFWTFCSRPVTASSSSRQRLRRSRSPHLSIPIPPTCPTCSPYPSSSRATPLLDASGTNSSSGVFEESSSCAHCKMRLLMDIKIGEEGKFGASDTSSAISGCGELDTGTIETLICSAPNARHANKTGKHSRSWTSFTDSRNRGSFESIVCNSTKSARQYRSSRPLRRHAHFQGLNLTMPSHQRDWFLNLPATVRRSNDDTETRPVHSPSAESGRLFPPPNLNPFLEEPNFRCQTVELATDVKS